MGVDHREPPVGEEAGAGGGGQDRRRGSASSSRRRASARSNASVSPGNRPQRRAPPSSGSSSTSTVSAPARTAASRRGKTSRPAADHGHVAKAVILVEIAARRAGGQTAQPGLGPDVALPVAPAPLRAIECLVIETDRQEAGDAPDPGLAVALQAAAIVLAEWRPSRRRALTDPPARWARRRAGQSSSRPTRAWSAGRAAGGT